ncbi:MAG: DDE-type integrase/transposase/recombinase [Anaerolineae bacterium]|nr:DDE-type integrase/transposase/recombinase [Anaerolineae bacterium]
MEQRTTSPAQRVALVERHQAGESYHQIARDCGLNYYTVRKWCRRQRRVGWAGVAQVCGSSRRRGALSHFSDRVKYVALKLKRQHPGWGLDKLLLEMQRRPSLQGHRLPRRSSLYNYLKSFYPRLRLHRPPRCQRPRLTQSRASEAHQCWQMDFKGEVPFVHLDKVKPFIVCDEYTSAPLAGILHSGQPGALTMADVQHDLRQVFSQWGLPDRLRMDRDPLWVGSSRLDFPSRLLLWLVGLGVTPVINRPHRPTDNAQVERCNGIWFEQVARGAQPATWDALQQQTDRAWQDRRELLPSRNPRCAGQPPAVAVPALLSPRRPFARDREAALFDLQQVFAYLATWKWQRVVDITGQISLGSFSRRVLPQTPRTRHRQLIALHFDLPLRLFVARTLDGEPLSTFTLPYLSPDFLMGTGSVNLDSS